MAKSYGPPLAAFTTRQEYEFLDAIFYLITADLKGALFLIVMGGKVNSWDEKATTTFPPWKIPYQFTIHLEVYPIW